MGTFDKKSAWNPFSRYRKERKAGTTITGTTVTTPTHHPLWSRDRANSPNTSNAQSSDRPPPYQEAELPTIRISAPAEPESDSQYAFLGQFHTIFLVDDSSSMRGALWDEAKEAIAAIAPICTKYDSEGIDIYFINHRPKPNTNTGSSYNSNSSSYGSYPAYNIRSSCRPKPSGYNPGASSNYIYNYSPGPGPSRPTLDAGGYHNIKTAERVSEIFASVRPSGGTGVGGRLFDILDPYTKLLEAKETERQAQKHVSGMVVRSIEPEPVKSVKPINIITITDGVFTDDAESIIIKTAQTLDSPSCHAMAWQVGIQFFQIGNDEMARQYLEVLDKGLWSRCHDLHLRDIVDTVSWRNRAGERLEGYGILKAVLGAVHKKLDRDGEF